MALATPKSSGGTVKVLAERFVRWSLVPLGVGVALGAGAQALSRGGGGEFIVPPGSPSASVATVVASAPAVSVELAPEPPVPPAVVTTPSATLSSTLSAERNVLDRARVKLAADDPLASLAFLEQHLRRFPRGQLSEEREAMRINVLVRLERLAEAKARGEAFAARFPHSLMGPSVRAALRSSEAADGATE